MNAIKELGAKLVQDSRLNDELCTQRGLIFHLFPFIFEASKRMSSRAIVRWLEAYGTKLSLATVAKALRNPKFYWQEIYDDIEPAARVFAEAHNLEIRALLSNHELFFNLVHDKSTFPTMEGRLPYENAQDLFDVYLDACAKLQQDWFCMPAASIEACLASIPEEEYATSALTTESEPEAVTTTAPV
jgi:hypothetical protein